MRVRMRPRSGDAGDSSSASAISRTALSSCPVLGASPPATRGLSARRLSGDAWDFTSASGPSRSTRTTARNERIPGKHSRESHRQHLPPSAERRRDAFSPSSRLTSSSMSRIADLYAYVEDRTVSARASSGTVPDRYESTASPDRKPGSRPAASSADEALRSRSEARRAFSSAPPSGEADALNVTFTRPVSRPRDRASAPATKRDTRAAFER